MSDILARARDAAAILENPLFAEAIEALRTETVAAWVATKSDQAADRDRLWTMVKMIDRLRAYFETVAESGRLETNRATRNPLP